LNCKIKNLHELKYNKKNNLLNREYSHIISKNYLLKKKYWQIMKSIFATDLDKIQYNILISKS
jgi:hypothetical protein